MPKKVKLEDGTEIEIYTKEDIDKEVDGLKSKNAQLLDEAKEERRKRQELERQKEEDETKSREKQGEFKSLYEKEKEKNDALQAGFDQFKATTQDRDIGSQASIIASGLTKDKGRQKLLAKEIRQFAKYDEKDGVLFEIDGKKVDNDGIVGHISKEYPFLVDGSAGSGSGAGGSGSSRGGGATKTATRSQFEQLSPQERVDFSKSGGQIISQ